MNSYKESKEMSSDSGWSLEKILYHTVDSARPRFNIPVLNTKGDINWCFLPHALQ